MRQTPPPSSVGSTHSNAVKKGCLTSCLQLCTGAASADPHASPWTLCPPCLAWPSTHCPRSLRVLASTSTSTSVLSISSRLQLHFPNPVRFPPPHHPPPHPLRRQKAPQPRRWASRAARGDPRSCLTTWMWTWARAPRRGISHLP